MIQAGRLSGPELEIHGRPFQAGDQIVCLRNNRRLGINNGTRATITHVDPDHRNLDIETPRGPVRLPADYIGGCHVAHGYATTIHKTQGATVDHGLLLGTDELFRERGYVGMSRGRLTNHLYLVGVTEPDDSTSHGLPEVARDPSEAVRRALARLDQQHLAIDSGHIAEGPPPPPTEPDVGLDLF
jgi:ATP-dependent exoDNAse (exonuclease V) alpha subunit